MQHSSNPSLARLRLAAILFAMTYPTFLTWVYFLALNDASGLWQRAAFGIGKAIQFGFPAVWIFVILRRRGHGFEFSTRGLVWALLLGIAQLALGLAIYLYWLKPAGIFVGPLAEMQQKLRGFGIDTRWGYALLAVAYSLVHSGLEEYYWRWFVLKELQDQESIAKRGAWLAILISSLAFAAHHVIVLAGYFGWTSVWTYVLSAAVAIGGGIFGWLYVHSRSIYAPWLAHAFADVAIFLIGYDLLAGSLR